MIYECVGTDGENASVIFRYRASTPPLARDRIVLSDDELAGESFTDKEWMVMGRQFAGGTLQLVVEPYRGGMVLA